MLRRGAGAFTGGALRPDPERAVQQPRELARCGAKLSVTVRALRASCVITLLGSVAVAGAAESTSYICNGKQAIGFAIDKRTHAWLPTQFNSRQYVIRVPKRGADQPSGALTAVFAVYEVGQSDFGPLFCDEGFNSAGYLRCSGLGDTFLFNRKTLRFEHWLPYGYVDPPGSFWSPEGSTTPFIEIDTCAPI